MLISDISIAIIVQRTQRKPKRKQMNKYINADKLFTKIVELKKELPNTIEHLNDEESGFARGQQYELTAIESEILCLQQEQPEVDLEKEIDRFWDSCIKHKNERGGNVIWSNKIEIEVLARHFYELGLNARKEE